MKLSDIILENELERFSVSGQMKQTDNIVDQVAKAIAEKYDMKDDGMLRGTIRDAVITAKYDMDEEINEEEEFEFKTGDEIDLTYVDPNGPLYSITKNGRKVDRHQGREKLEKLVGIKIPYSDYEEKTLEQIKSKLQDQDIELKFDNSMNID